MEVPLHPLVVHLPIALAVVMPLLAGAVLLAVARQWLPARAHAFVLAGQLLLFASSFVAMRTGEADEDVVERLVPKAAIEGHEDAAKLFFWGAGLVLALAAVPLLPWVRRRARALQVAGAATLVGTLVVLGLGYAVGRAGGELVYGHGAAAAFTTSALPAPPADRRHGDER